MCVCVCVCVCIIYQRRISIGYKAYLNGSLSSLNSVFFFLDWFRDEDERPESALLFAQYWKENSWMNTFL